MTFADVWCLSLQVPVIENGAFNRQNEVIHAAGLSVMQRAVWPPAQAWYTVSEHMNDLNG